jgi:RHS repeat-associated protein
VTSNYTYDAIYELTKTMQGAATTESYGYDPVGNRLSSLGVSSYTNNSSNQLTASSSASYGYDSNGSTLTKTDSTGTTNYTWDFENRLTSVTLPGAGGTVSFKCDPFGRRIYKSSSSGASIYAYDGDNVAEETNATGAVVARYSQDLAIDEPLAMLRSGTTSFYNADALGTVTSLGNGAGSLAQTYTFDSFGKQTASSGSLTNPFRYTGREFDSETGLYFYRARYFDPQAGRFLSEDPSGFRGGINLYAYTMNSPTGWIDPTGLAMSPEECRKLLEDIRRRADILARKIAKYDPIADGLGGATYRAGGQIRKTVPGSHFGQIVGMQINLAIDIYKYQRDCGSGPKLPPCVYVPAYKKIPQPVFPKTMLELQLEEESARYMEKFWTDILIGAAALGAGYSAPAALGGAGAGALGWLPALAY